MLTNIHNVYIIKLFKGKEVRGWDEEKNKKGP